MDNLFNSSVTETFGIVTLEAMSCGVPVVGANSPGTASLVVNGLNGRLIAEDDIDSFADAIANYVAWPVERTAAGSAAYSSAAKCSWDGANRSLAANYTRIIERHAACKPI